MRVVELHSTTWQFCGDKASNPLIAMQATSGMGKSTLIDAIAALSFAQIAEMSPGAATPEFHRAVSESVRVTVDYHDYQPATDMDLEHPVAGLALRILHSCVLPPSRLRSRHLCRVFSRT